MNKTRKFSDQMPHTNQEDEKHQKGRSLKQSQRLCEAEPKDMNE